jgi:orotate phosphoribosyltransferase-like protein
MVLKELEFTTLEAKNFTKRNEKMGGQIRIDTNSTVTQITEKSDKEAEVEFRYSVTYGGAGMIKVEGRLIFEGDAPKLAKEWGEKRNMPTEMASEIHTGVIQACIPIAILMARDLKLRLPIPLPNIGIKEEKSKKKGESSGMEVA